VSGQRVTWDVRESPERWEDDGEGGRRRVTVGRTHWGTVQAWVAVPTPALVGTWMVAVVADDDGTFAQVALHDLRHESAPRARR